MRPEEIAWEATYAPEPDPPPFADLLGTPHARRAAARYHLFERARGASKLGLIAATRVLPAGLGPGAGAAILGPLVARHYAGGPMVQRMHRALARLRPDLAEEEARRALLERWFANVTRTMLEYGAIERLAAPPHLELEGEEVLAALRAQRRSAVIVTVHTGTWELISHVVSSRMPMVAPYQPQPDRYENRIVCRTRRRYGAKTLPPSPSLARTLYRILAEPGQAVVILLDELAQAENAVRFPLFGRAVPERTNVSFAVRAAQRAGAPIVPVTIGRVSGPRQRFTLHPPIEVGEGQAARRATIEGLSAFYEAHILARLDEWYMLKEYKV